jgi:catechol 2,3-dioxygenase-like lactoylglutathione lyase family enzyme
MDKPSVREVRVAITVEDFEGALGLWRGALGLDVTEEWDRPDGRGSILAAGRATIELIDTRQAVTIDEVEVGQRVSGLVRLALNVRDAAVTAERVATAGAEHLAGPIDTPWGDLNARVVMPGGLQVTLFEVAAVDG